MYANASSPAFCGLRVNLADAITDPFPCQRKQPACNTPDTKMLLYGSAWCPRVRRSLVRRRIRGDMKAQFPDEETKSGEFKRQEDAFREWVSNDDSTPYAAEAGRYHLYVSLACPWASRTIIV